MTQATQPMNFLPEDYVEKRQAARTAVVCVGLLVVVLGGVVGAWMFKRQASQPILDEAAKVNAEIAAAAGPIAQAKAIDDEKNQLLQKAEMTSLLVEKVHRSEVIQELKRLRPKGVTITSLQLHSKDLVPPPISEAEKTRREAEHLPPEAPKPPDVEVTLDIKGTSQVDGQMTQYVSALSKSPLFSDVNMLSAEEGKTGEGDSAMAVRLFVVQMKISPHADRHLVAASAASIDSVLQ